MKDPDQIYIVEDSSDSWQAQKEMEQHHRSDEPRPSLTELTERLGQAIAILNVLDPEFLKIRKQLIRLRDDLKKKNLELSEQAVDAARKAGL